MSAQLNNMEQNSTKSKNMNYYFNVEYFDGIDLSKKSNEITEKKIKSNNNNITEFQFNAVSPLDACDEMKGYENFELYTVYPGLLIGTGYPHDVAIKGAIKQGFSFDYVTGLPYIPGSSLKGMLRAYFPDDTKDNEKNKGFTELIRGILNKSDLDVKKFTENIFENNDIFLGAYPVSEKKVKLMEMEYITSHKEKFKNPNPISLVKIRPGVKFKFSFILSDYEENGEVLVTASEKKVLFEELVTLMGIGAKTNTGFGRFTNAKCEKCEGPVGINIHTGKPHKWCAKCNQNKKREKN